MSVHVPTDVRARSTEAAREYVRSARARLQMERDRYGAEAEQRSSYRELQQTLHPDELSRMWPHADLDEALSA